MADALSNEQDEILGGIKDSIKQRLASPLLFGFLISWCVINYQFLLVVFSDETFKNKIAYISSSVDLMFWRPMGVGVVAAIALPLATIPYSAFRQFCLNWEQRAEMVVKRRRPMETDAQVEEFKRLGKIINELRAEKANLKTAAVAREKHAEQNIQKLHSRLHSHCISALNPIGLIGNARFRDALLGIVQDEVDRNIVLSSLRPHPMTPKIKQYADYIESLPTRENGLCEVNVKNLFDHMHMSDETFPLFLDILSALDFLRIPAFPLDGQIHGYCPAGQQRYLTAVALVRLAAQ